MAPSREGGWGAGITSLVCAYLRNHRRFGRFGGLGFIVNRGTIGGTVMNAGFAVYGLLMILAAFETYRQTRKRRWEIHRAGAVRLFALVTGSWLYRMDYGFWPLAE